MSALRTLRDARQILSQEGVWTKGQYNQNIGGGVVRHCLVGALDRSWLQGDGREGQALDSYSWAKKAVREVIADKLEMADPIDVSIEAWNDSSATKLEDVLDVLDKAIEKEESKL